MKYGMHLAPIPPGSYNEYKYDVIFNGYKWDPQVEDENTVSQYALLMETGTAAELADMAEALAAETMQMENALIEERRLVKNLSLPTGIYKQLRQFTAYNPREHVRLMRFDFHPTEEGWRVSEVNSDVPGGIAEASALPGITGKFFPGYGPSESVGEHLLHAFEPPEKGIIAFIHATSYSDDRQVMQYLNDSFARRGYDTIFAAPNHIKWENGRAHSILTGRQGEVSGIVRFFPAEWLPNLPKSTNWQGYFSGVTKSCNHPAVILSQSKRLPLIWNELKVPHGTWEGLLPETLDPRKVKPDDEQWIFKPAFGRVGEDITIKGTMAESKRKSIITAARRYHRDWVAQRMFRSKPLETKNDGSFHMCIGVFTVNGAFAGFYGRMSPYPLIDAKAKDIPILVACDS